MVHKRSWVNKEILVQINFKSEKFLGPENCFGSNKFEVKKLWTEIQILVPIKFFAKKILIPQKCR